MIDQYLTKQAYSVNEFCQVHGISRGFFYKLRKAGKAPRVTKIGDRTLIRAESAEEWLSSLEESSQ